MGKMLKQYFLNMYSRLMAELFPTKLQLNRANSSDTDAPFLDLNLCISNGTVSTKIYDKWDDFDFDIVNFPFLDGDVPRRTSYGVYSEQFRKLVNRYKRIDYSLDIMRQTACLVVNSIIVDGYALLFNCTTAVQASDSMTASS